MNLKNKLEKFCEEMYMVLPIPDSNNQYMIQFDDCFHIKFLADKMHHVLLTSFFRKYSELTFETIETHMKKSYAWPGLSTSFVLSSHDQYSIQTLIPKISIYKEFYTLVNFHCGFCELILDKKINDIKPTVEHHVYIKP